MIREIAEQLEFLHWKEQGVRIVCSKKAYGNVKEKTEEELCQDFSFGDRKIATGHQTHSDHIVCIQDGDALFWEDTDALVTKRKDIVLFNKYADCMPVFLFDPIQEVIAVIHSGWKGSYQEIAGKTVDKMCEEYGSRPADIQAVFGVGISQKNYEVGEEFFQDFWAHFPSERVHQAFLHQAGKIYFDNQEFILQTLLARGLLLENIFTNHLCSFDGDYHSYRRDREKSGRNGAFIYFEK